MQERAARLLDRLGAGAVRDCFIVPGRIEVLGPARRHAPS